MLNERYLIAKCGAGVESLCRFTPHTHFATVLRKLNRQMSSKLTTYFVTITRESFAALRKIVPLCIKVSSKYQIHALPACNVVLITGEIALLPYCQGVAPKQG
jgi:hypothetical protein